MSPSQQGRAEVGQSPRAHQHRARTDGDGNGGGASAGWLRAATFGAMDGLVTNIALVAGVSGGGGNPDAIILAGGAGLVAGAISMAFGEYTSVKTQNEQIGSEVERKREALLADPDGETTVLAQNLQRRGLPEDVARRIADATREHPEQALRFHVQEELGVSPEYAPSPWVAAMSSFVTFAIGALIPLLPYLFGFAYLWLALAVGAAGLLTAGALASRFTGRPWWFGALRQLVLGAVAAGATYAIGVAIGTTVA